MPNRGECLWCGKSLRSKRASAKYCCDTHRSADRRRREQGKLARLERIAAEKAPPRRPPVPSDQNKVGVYLTRELRKRIDEEVEARPLRVSRSRVIRDILTIYFHQ